MEAGFSSCRDIRRDSRLPDRISLYLRASTAQVLTSR